MIVDGGMMALNHIAVRHPLIAVCLDSSGTVSRDMLAERSTYTHWLE